jgi:hypothetical protein
VSETTGKPSDDPQYVTFIVQLNEPSLDAIRQIVREEVHKALNPPEQQSEAEVESPFIGSEPT